ncbi:hypothetical protein C8J56DRAFT_1915 [Mycena floridula]|nr:hypothetical protein C8J56DRAFT_1915 [Mycena floridula]
MSHPHDLCRSDAPPRRLAFRSHALFLSPFFIARPIIAMPLGVVLATWIFFIQTVVALQMTISPNPLPLVPDATVDCKWTKTATDPAVFYVRLFNETAGYNLAGAVKIDGGGSKTGTTTIDLNAFQSTGPFTPGDYRFDAYRQPKSVTYIFSFAPGARLTSVLQAIRCQQPSRQCDIGIHFIDR